MDGTGNTTAQRNLRIITGNIVKFRSYDVENIYAIENKFVDTISKYVWQLTRSL